MRILPEPVVFLWDEGNFDKNFQKHKVSIQEAEEMFMNEPLTITQDLKHSTSRESRLQALGKTRSNRKLFAAITIRDKKIRVISIRDMSTKEEKEYEKFERNS